MAVCRPPRRDPDPVAALKTQVRCRCRPAARPLLLVLIEAISIPSIASTRAGRLSCTTTTCGHCRRGAALPPYSTVRRYLKVRGCGKQPALSTCGPARAAAERVAAREVRSFEVEHVNALWHLDFHHGSRKVLTPRPWVKPMLLAVLDDRSRLACHVQWYLDETAKSLVHGFCQALQRRGLPRR